MLHCFSVIDRTHLCDPATPGASRCGLKMAHGVPSLKFVDADAMPTCHRCIGVADAVASQNDLPLLGKKEVVVAVLEHGLSSDDPRAASTLLGTDQVRFCDAVKRLRALFPGWTARVIRMIAEGDHLFATYGVTCTDPNHLLGLDRLEAYELIDSAVFRICPTGNEQLVLDQVEPVNDHFGIWKSTGLTRAIDEGADHVG